jgi:hypothetical protein
MFADAIDSYSLLALAISEAIIVAHRGTLRAESEGVTKGASFILASLISWSDRKGSREPITGYGC